MFSSKIYSVFKKTIFLSIFVLIAGNALTGCSQSTAPKESASAQNATSEKDISLDVAVEYTDHAAAFYYAQGKNLFSGTGIKINDVKVYASGVGVAAAFTKGGFDVSYMCLVPAIFTYANGGVPIKIIAGTHKNGYGLIVNSAKIQELSDLEKTGIKIANGPEGTSTDFLQKLLIENKNIDSEKIMSNTVRMNAAKQLMALRSGKVDAIFVPEHFATLAASFPSMKMLLKSTDIWPDMQGSVLVVTEELLKNQPETVEKLKEINKNSIQLMNENPQAAAEIVAQNLNINQMMVKEETQSPEANLEVTSEIAAASMNNLIMTPEISIEEVQAVIDKMYAMGYLTKSFDAKEIMAVD
ncbi:ABC transporter substrate-binding protein [Acidaminobacter hydrogenoformans]|uniref:NitT/TauT family transport system substrate-binding protein n=1 Tax=Acidaminobacter hydrogenoformans DSM 2784 TaxID=1120920 RepID=A0A1G5RZM4_9FIRM|nr:ABC transporter substrate-binding protein [Acidaminobacter hydrogenoformans]SCZ79463.1 NitT/TauT family transport system substrate-binding protein [Acidaminobacter hydrogenoformans DSM 2784]